MSSQHKAPLAAFFVVSIACIVVVVNALRSDALSGIFVNPTQAIVAGARLIPAPQDILSAEAKVAASASAGLTITPKVAHEVVSNATNPAAAAEPKRHQAHHHAHRATGTATSAAVTQTVVSTPSVPTNVTTTPETTVPPTNSHGHGGSGWTHPSHHTTSATEEPTYGHEGHQSDSSASSNSQWGWGGSKSHDHGNRGHGSHGQSSGRYDDRSTAAPNTSDDHSSSGRGHGNRRGDDGHGDRGNGWSGDDRGSGRSGDGRGWSDNDRGWSDGDRGNGRGWSGDGRGSNRGHRWS